MCARVHACVRDTQRATTQRATWRRSFQVTDRAPYIGERASRCHERTIASVMGMEFRDMSGNVRHYKRADVAYVPRGHCRGVQPLPLERASERRTADSRARGDPNVVVIIAFRPLSRQRIAWLSERSGNEPNVTLQRIATCCNTAQPFDRTFATGTTSSAVILP